MARKSRKNKIIELQKESYFNTALYSRLSIEDSGNKDLNTIQNQINIIKNYTQNKPYLKIIDIYCDNGNTGTNFERPEFKRMIEDIKRGKINCIIVKDLSRFGRNFIETGKYIEQILPFFKVRLISVTENYDSFDKNNSNNEINIAIKNLVNDLYSQDLSLKIRSAKNTRMKTGKFIPSYIAYGYKKIKDNKNPVIIDEEASKVIKKIYKLALNGYKKTEIAAILNKERILTASMYRKYNNFNLNDTNDKIVKWTSNMIYKILKNEYYTGITINNKSSKDECIKINNTHEAIISEKDFKKVNSIISSRNKNKKIRKQIIFYKKIKCVGCKNLLKKNYSHENKYYCETYKITKNFNCFKEQISENEIKNILLIIIKNRFNIFLQDYNDIKKQIYNLENKLNNKKYLKFVNYKNYKFEKIEQKEYIYISNFYSNEINDIIETINYIKNKKIQPPIKEITRNVIDNFFSSIYLYDIKHIEIVYNFKEEYV